MPKITWGNPDQRTFEAGVDRGVLYVDSAGVAWNGLINVNQEMDGGGPLPTYIDGLKFRNISSFQEFGATIQAFGSPPEFKPCEGYAELAPGLFAAEQRRSHFSMSYRTWVGSNTGGLHSNYKIHLIYNASAAPSSRSHETTSNSPKPVVFSWKISTKPQLSALLRQNSYLVIESKSTPPNLLAHIEGQLYGDDTTAPMLPTIDEIVSTYSTWVE